MIGRVRAGVDAGAMVLQPSMDLQPVHNQATGQLFHAAAAGQGEAPQTHGVLPVLFAKCRLVLHEMAFIMHGGYVHVLAGMCAGAQTSSVRFVHQHFQFQTFIFYGCRLLYRAML